VQGRAGQVVPPEHRHEGERDYGREGGGEGGREGEREGGREGGGKGGREGGRERGGKGGRVEGTDMTLACVLERRKRKEGREGGRAY